MNVDRKNKLVRRYHVSDAASQAVDHLPMKGNTGQAADQTRQGQQQDQVIGARPGRAHLRREDQGHGRHADMPDRHGVREGEGRHKKTPPATSPDTKPGMIRGIDVKSKAPKLAVTGQNDP